MNRSIKQILTARPASDGAGVKLNRVFGGGQNSKDFDPFLMLDEFGSDDASDYIAGFPSHPHRGFETVTYMLNGKMLHEDHMGNKGLLNSGDVQWMTAARGIIHSEMPQQEEGLMRGFQLWLNLPSNEKMKDPSYKDIEGSLIPSFDYNGAHIKLIAGEIEFNDKKYTGVINGLSTDPYFLDVHLSENNSISIPAPDGHTVFVYVYEGEISIGDSEPLVESSQVALLNKTGQIQLKNNNAARAIVLMGKPINEPIAQYGPFVMNTNDEIEQAIQDYRSGTLTD